MAGFFLAIMAGILSWSIQL